MPVSATAKREMRVTVRRTLRNKSIRTACKTNITKAEKLIFSGDSDQTRKAVIVAITTLDKAANKGVIPANNAARRKSRLMQKLNKLQAG